MEASGAPFPALNIYYDNAGSLPALAVVSRHASGFASGGYLSDMQIMEAQDNLLACGGWQDAMAEKAGTELYQGEGQFLSIPNREGEGAENFRAQFDDVFSGTDTLYVFIAFKYRDQSMPENVVGVTEFCGWFQGNPVRHVCGRSRSFLQQVEEPSP